MSTLKVEQISHPDSSTPAITLDSTGAMSGAIPAGGRNRIINGGFDVWQRGTSQTTGGYGSADRWNMNFSGATGTASQQEFTVGQTEVPGEPKYYLRFQTTVANDNSGPGQFIEDVRTFAGQTVTLSFWGKADSAITIQNQIQQYFGSGGSAFQVSDSVEHTMSTTWQRYVSTITLPSIAGKTITTNDHLRVWINNPNTETFTFDIWGVQLELGSVATPFEHRSYGDELARCMRYYESGYFWEEGTNALSGNQYMIQIPFKVKKRTNATISYGNVSGPNANINITGAEPGYVAEANGAQSNLYDGFMMRAVPTNSTSTIRQYWTASAEL